MRLVVIGRSEVARAISAPTPDRRRIIFDGSQSPAARHGGPPRHRAGPREPNRGARAVALGHRQSVVSALRKLFPHRLFDPRQAQRTADGLITQLRSRPRAPGRQ